MRKCISCCGEYPDALFATYTKHDGSKGVLNTCKACKVENNAKYRPKVEKVDTAGKVCNVCQVEKPFLDFSQYVVKGHTYHRPTCKCCINEKQRQKYNAGKPAAEKPPKVVIPKAKGLDIIAYAISLQSRLFRYAAYLLKDDATAADMLQNVFLSLLNNKHRYAFTCERTLKNFLYRSVKNECLEYFRSAKNIAVDFSEVQLPNAFELMRLEALQIHLLLKNFSHVEYKLLKYMYDGHTAESIAPLESLHPSFVKNTLQICKTKIQLICQTQ